MPEVEGLDRSQWEEKLDLLGAALRGLGVSVRLEIIGSWPLIEAGMLQIVQPGIVSIPEHVPLLLAKWGGLTLYVPPPAALAAAKLTRAQPKDIADVLFLRGKYHLERAEVAAYVEKIADHAPRETARENLVYFG